jgi:hypothetical protein
MAASGIYSTSGNDPLRPVKNLHTLGAFVSKFRVKYFVLLALAVFLFGILTSQASSLVLNIAKASFLLIALLQFYIRCESCGSTIVDYMFHWDDSWFEKPSPLNPVFSVHCPKCGTERI